jgi:glycosyltransferase involved in cell wall biosynthesis
VTSKKKVVFFCPRFHTNMTGWVEGLSERDWDVHVWTLFNGASDSNVSATRHTVGYSHLWRLLAFRRRMDAYDRFSYKFGPLSLSGTLRAFFTTGRPDVLIVRNVSRMSSVGMILLGLSVGCRIVLYTQGPKFREKVSRLRRFANWFLYDAMGMYGMTPVKGPDEPKAYTHPRIRYVPFSKKVEATDADVDKRAAQPPTVIVVGKFQPVKNHILAIDALATVETACRPHMLIVGECSRPEQLAYLEKLKARVEELGLEKLVEFRPNVPVAEMPDLYRRASLFILPSFSETAAVSPLEAMSFGVPVLSTTKNGTAPYVHPGRDGDVFDPHDAVILGHLVRDWTANPETMRKAGREALKTCAAEHSPSNFAVFLAEVMDD